MSIPEYLRNCPLFFELFDKEVESLVRQCSVYTFDPGEFIVNDGERGDQIFILLDGEATIEKAFDGERVEIHRLGRGEVLARWR